MSVSAPRVTVLLVTSSTLLIARSCVLRSEELSPEEKSYLFGQYFQTVKIDDDEQAQAILSQARTVLEEEVPGDTYPYILQGVYHYMNRNFSAAAKEYELALKKDPDNGGLVAEMMNFDLMFF